MSDEQKAREDEVFNQELSMEDLDAAAGGQRDCTEYMFAYQKKDFDRSNCVVNYQRQIYGGNGFPNCAATVENGSHYVDNDACFEHAIQYQGFTGGCHTSDCRKAWR